MSRPLAELLIALRELFRPLSERVSSAEALEYLFYRYGWEVSLDEATFTQLDQALAFKEPLERFLSVADSIRERLESDPDSRLSPEEVIELADAGAALTETVAGLRALALTGVPEPFGDEGFWASIADHLFDDLLAEYLRLYHPNAYLVLHFGGVLRHEPTEQTSPFRRPYIRTVIDLRQLQALLRDPVDALKQTYVWGDPVRPFEHERFLEVLAAVLGAIHFPTTPFAPSIPQAVGRLPEDSAHRVDTDAQALRSSFLEAFSPRDQTLYEFGVELFPAMKGNETTPSGLILSPIIRGGAAGELPLGNGLLLRWDLEASAGQAQAVSFFPGETALISSQPTLAATVEVAAMSNSPRYLFGNSQTARLELYNPSISFSLGGNLGDPELKLRLSTKGENGQPGSKVVIPLDGADGFLKETVGQNALTLSFSPEIIWSNKTGLTFNGKLTPSIDLPLNLSIGAVSIQRLSIYLRPMDGASDSVFEFAASAGLSITLGPVVASVDQVGFSVGLDFGREKKNLGFVDVSVGFKPPTGLGLSVEGPGVVGGGFLGFKQQNEEYSGVLELQIAEKISVKAVGMLTTTMPDGGGGYSLVALIFVEGFAPIQLGLGFVLTGIGGVIAVNRTFDEEALRAGLKNHTLDSVMFPKDPVRNAPQILSNLNRVFPVSMGHYLFGPMLQIVWGTPTLITMNLAVVLELGARMRLLVLGQVSAILPKSELDMVRLRLDAVGVVDFDQGTASLDATLFDSRLMNRFVLTGDMAMRLRWESPRNFALAVGGLHPAFNPPHGFPKLDRIAINLSAGDNPRFRCEAYFAITSNTLQFGARADLYASAGNFNIQGEVGFDVLIQRDPFHFTADFRAQVQVKRGATSLFKVRVEGALSGPRPLHVRGRVTFEIFWWDITVGFDKTLVEGEKPLGPAPVEVLPHLRAALESPGNWVGVLPEGRNQMVTLRARRAAQNEVLLHPLGTLTVKQNVVPLDTPISLFAQAPPAGAYLFKLDAVTTDTRAEPTTAVEDYFAPAQFFELSDDEQLSRPSFEPMPAGVSLGLERFSFPPEMASATQPANWLVTELLVFETVTIDPEQGESRSDRDAPEDHDDPHKKKYSLTHEAFKKQYKFGAAGASDLRRTGRDKYRARPRKYKLEREGWAVINADDASPQPAEGVGAGATYTEATRLLRQENLLNPAGAAARKVVRPSEIERLYEPA